MNADILNRLADAIGPQSMFSEYSVAVPAEGDALLSVLRICAETSTPVSVLSTARGSTTTPPDGGLLINLERLNTIEVRAAALTLRAGTGAQMTDVVAAAAAEGLAITGLGSGPMPASVGALVAKGAVSRRSITGVDAALVNGDTISFGGVLKDVVGYDVPAVLLGSMGRLAVIVTVTFRLEPVGAHTVAPAPAPGPVALEPEMARAFDPTSLLRATT
ncbi:MAG: FAD-binding oxidoreductase [Candidatus Dormibacteria bacterium]